MRVPVTFCASATMDNNCKSSCSMWPRSYCISLRIGTSRFISKKVLQAGCHLGKHHKLVLRSFLDRCACVQLIQLQILGVVEGLWRTWSWRQRVKFWCCLRRFRSWTEGFRIEWWALYELGYEFSYLWEFKFRNIMMISVSWRFRYFLLKMVMMKLSRLSGAMLFTKLMNCN